MNTTLPLRQLSPVLLSGFLLTSPPTHGLTDPDHPLAFDLGDSTQLKLEIFERLRGEAVDWFGDVKVKDLVIDRNSDYGFMGNKFQLGLRLNHEDWLESFVQFQDTTLAAIPTDAVGLGARYYENSQHINQNSGFLRQGHLKLKHAGAWIDGGRQLYLDGAQNAVAHPSLKWIQDFRLAQRLIGPFDYTHAGRSFDGGALGYGTGDWEVSGFGFMPTQGGFDINGMDTITDINVAGITLNLHDGDLFGNTLGRLAWYTYNDTRPDVAVVDNSQTVPPQLGANISLHTIGGHLARIEPAGPGQFDGTVYGFSQFGNWQTQNQSAWAYGVELGYQLKDLWASPWLRAGINSASGDSNPDDQTHGTFFQMLPTAWLYAQFPFYNMMNNQDVFVQMILRPDPTVTVRADFHSLSVNATEDLVYSSSGAGNTQLFGFLGMPTYGQSDLANVTHVSVGWRPLDNLSINAFYAHSFGQSIIDRNFTGSQGDYGFLETIVTF